MVTTQSAFNSLERVCEYVNQNFESEGSLYTKGIENLKRIREQAAQIMLLANDTLARVDEDNPKYMIKSEPSELIEIASQAATTAVMNVLSQLNIIGEQHIHADNVLQVNMVEDKPKSETPPNSTINQYKTAAHKVTQVPDEQFSDENVQECAQLCDTYFQTRFNLKYDLNRIHRFDKKQFRNYLASIVITYAQSYTDGQTEIFKLDFDDWINQIKQGTMPYTLPKSCASIFFKILKDEDLALDSVTTECAKSIWNELWLLGYNQLYSENTYSPTYDLSWIFESSTSELFDTAFESSNLTNHEYAQLKHEYLDYIECSKLNNYFERWAKILEDDPRYYKLLNQKTRVVEPETICKILLYDSNIYSIEYLLEVLSKFNSNMRKSNSDTLEILSLFQEYVEDYCE